MSGRYEARKKWLLVSPYPDHDTVFMRTFFGWALSVLHGVCWHAEVVEERGVMLLLSSLQQDRLLTSILFFYTTRQS